MFGNSRLHTRLTLGFGALLLLLGLLLATLITRIAARYHAEVTQRLNASIAMYVTQELALLDANGINRTALDELAHRAMTVNPSAEVYLLDNDGAILATLIPATRVQRRRVALAPIRRFLAGEAAPLYGDDPSSLSNSQVFSVAPVMRGEVAQGYLYVVLASEKFSSIAAAVRGNYSLQIALAAGVAMLLLVAALSSALFGWLTLPLRRLAARMTAWSRRMSAEPDEIADESADRDEIAALNRQFALLTARIERQIDAIAARDAQRRELIANVSHDLRTPLASLHGYLETVLLKGDPLPAATRHEYLEIAHRHSQRLKRLIDALFELSKLEAGAIALHVETFSVADLLNDVALRFRLRAQRFGVQLLAATERNQVVASADLALVERVLENLIDNALRHTPANGRIVLSAHALATHVEVSVADSGGGIDANALPHVFERLYRSQSTTSSAATPSSEGVGLGLAIVKCIVQLHGQSVAIRSAPGQGTTVSFGLPLSKPPDTVASANLDGAGARLATHNAA